MEIEVEAGRPEDSSVYRISSKSSGEKPRRTKHRPHFPNPNGSADVSHRTVSKPKIFRLLRSRGSLSEYMAKLRQFITGLIDRNNFCSYLVNTLTKSEIKYHNRFILGVIRNDKQRDSRKEKRKSEHRSRTEYRGKREGCSDSVMKDGDGFAVPPPIAKKKKRHSRRDDDRRRKNSEGDNSCGSAQGPAAVESPPGSHHVASNPVEPGIPCDLSQYLQGLDVNTLEHLVQETSKISQLLQASSSSSLPHSSAASSEEHRIQTPQSAISQTSELPATIDSTRFCPNKTTEFQGSGMSGVSRISAFGTQQSPQQRPQRLDVEAHFPQYGMPELARQHHNHQFQDSVAGYDAPQNHGTFGRSNLASNHSQSTFQQSSETNFGTDFSTPFVPEYPVGENTAVASGYETSPEINAGHEKTTDSPDANLWWHSIVDPSVFQRGYPVLNAPEDHVSNYEMSTMWAQQFLQSNEHDNDYIYTSKA